MPHDQDTLFRNHTTVVQTQKTRHNREASHDIESVLQPDSPICVDDVPLTFKPRKAAVRPQLHLLKSNRFAG